MNTIKPVIQNCFSKLTHDAVAFFELPNFSTAAVNAANPPPVSKPSPSSLSRSVVATERIPSSLLDVAGVEGEGEAAGLSKKWSAAADIAANPPPVKIPSPSSLMRSVVATERTSRTDVLRTSG